MTSLPILVGLLVALIALTPVVRVLIALVAGRSVGESALAKVPDCVSLVAAGPDAWRDSGGAADLTARLQARGFEDGGIFGVREMPGVVIRLLAQPEESVMGIVYEHPQAGQWVELATRYADGTSYSVTTSRETGLDPRPGHVTEHLHGTSVTRLCERLLAARPAGMVEPARAADLHVRFEQGYAEAMAWRKAHGVSRVEVVKVATRKAA